MKNSHLKMWETRWDNERQEYVMRVPVGIISVPEMIKLREQLATANELNATLRDELAGTEVELSNCKKSAYAWLEKSNSLKEQLAAATAQRDRAMELLAAGRPESVVHRTGTAGLWEDNKRRLQLEIEKEAR
jgi:hypothetical protein